jgi:hypothetical protein
VLGDGAGSAVTSARVVIALELGATGLGSLRVGAAVDGALAGVAGRGEDRNGHEEDV